MNLAYWYKGNTRLQNYGLQSNCKNHLSYYDYRVTDYNAFFGGSWIDYYSILQNYKIRITRDKPCIWVLHDYRITDYNAIERIIYHSKFSVLHNYRITDYDTFLDGSLI